MDMQACPLGSLPAGMKKRAAGGFYMEYTVSALSKDAESIRTEVFIEEQGFSNEFDETDCIAEHIVFYENGTPAAVCRFYPDHEEGVFVAGRIAVRREFRGCHLGSFLMDTLDQEIRKRGGRKILLSAQEQAVPFYQKNGYHCVGEPYLDEFCPHIQMIKEL